MYPAYQYFENFTLSDVDKKIAGRVFLKKKSFFEKLKEFLSPKSSETTEDTSENVPKTTTTAATTTTSRPVIMTNIFTIENKKVDNKKSGPSSLILLGNTPCLENFQFVLKSKQFFSSLLLKYVK